MVGVTLDDEVVVYEAILGAILMHFTHQRSSKFV
jgi:hypothetical protein